MGSKSAQGGGKGKRKNDGPAEQRYKMEQRWQANKKASTSRGKREEAKHAAKHARRGTLGYRARQVARNARNAA
jgi:hypothetical protein